MTTGFFPGFDLEVDDDPPAVPVVPAPSSRNERLGKIGAQINSSRNGATHFDAFTFRVRQFTRGLPASRRREIDARRRFYRLPWIRRADEPDSDDFLA